MLRGDPIVKKENKNHPNKNIREKGCKNEISFFKKSLNNVNYKLIDKYKKLIDE